MGEDIESVEDEKEDEEEDIDQIDEGNCCECAEEKYVKGCAENEWCEKTVCESDDYCCSGAWDDTCVLLALDFNDECEATVIAEDLSDDFIEIEKDNNNEDEVDDEEEEEQDGDND